MAVGKGVHEVKALSTTTPLPSKSIHVFHFIESTLIFVQRYTHSRQDDAQKDVPQLTTIDLK
jgi:hypothetical protein